MLINLSKIHVPYDLREILWALHAPGVACRITPMNTMGNSSLQRHSLAPLNSSAWNLTNSRLADPWGGVAPRYWMAYHQLPLNLSDIFVLDAPIHVETVVLMIVTAIHLDEAEVHLGREDPFQVWSLLCADCLVSRISHPCAFRRRSRDSWKKSIFIWRPLSLLLFSSTCALPLSCFLRIIFLCSSALL